MKIWLDDVRNPPDDSWTWVKNKSEAIPLLMSGDVTHVSFDHDLGEIHTGYDLAKDIEKWAFEDYHNMYAWKFPKLTWDIHSANPVGRKNIEMAMRNAEKFWNSSE